MASSLSNLVNNLSEGIHRIKGKYGHHDNDYLIECKCLHCNKNYQHKFDEKLNERFFNTYKFSNHDSNNFILFLRKGAYPYE